MQTGLRVTTIAVAAVFLAGLAAAQERPLQATGQYQPLLKQADDLIGMDIKNLKEENLGSLTDIVLEHNNEYISYGVLEKDGSYYAIPWDMFQLTADEDALLLNIQDDVFARVEGFPSDRWPERADQRWRMQTADRLRYEQVYGRPAMPERRVERHQRIEAQDLETRRLSELMGIDVKSKPADEEQVGELSDLVLDFNQGLVAYGIVKLEEDKMAAVPWKKFEINREERVALVEATPTTLEQIAFTEMPNLADPQQAQRVHAQLEAEPYWEVMGFVGGPVDPQLERPDPLTRYYDRDEVTVITGTIQEVAEFDKDEYGFKGKRMHVQGEDGQTIIVHGGHEAFLQQQGLTLAQQDQVQIRGAYATVDGRTVFIASEIKKGDQTVWLRDQQGRPLWTREHAPEAQ